MSAPNTSKATRNPSMILFAGISMVILIMGILVNRALRKEIIDNRSSELESIAQLKVNQISDFRNERYSEASFLEGNKTFINSVNNYLKTRKSVYRDEISDWLNPIVDNHQYRSFTIVDAVKGQNIFSAGNDSIDWSRLKITRQGAIKCLDEQRIIFGTLSKENNQIFIPIYIPLLIVDKNRIHKIGVVEFIIDPAAGLYNLMQSMPSSGNTGEILVVRRDGDNVLFLNELRFKNNTSLSFKLPLNSPDLPAARAVLGEETAFIGTDYRGHEVLAVSKTVPDLEWKIVIKKDTKEIFQGLRFREILIYSSVAVLIVCLGLFFRHITDKRNLNFYVERVNDLSTIAKLSRLFKFLNNVERAIIKNPEKDNLLSEICTIIFNEGGYALCWVGLRNENTGIIECIAQCGLEKSRIEAFNYYINVRSKGTEENKITFIDRERFVSNDIINDARLDNWREKLDIEKFRSMAVFPLIQNSVMIGTVNLFSYELNYFKPDEIELFSQLCDDISYALDKIDLTERERKANDKYICANESLIQTNERIKKVNQDLIIAREKAEESDRLKSAFVANMSHEIRSPMNAIIGFADLMNTRNLSNKEIKEFTSIIILKSNELLHLIDDILDISKIESNTVTLFSETVLLNKILDEIHVVYRNRLDQSGKVHINLKCIKAPKDLNLEITTDITKFRQIFNNLLENAIKFTDTGQIEFGFMSHNYKELTCFVKDTGIGIDQKHHNRIFEIFRQADKDLRRNYGGTGLGLAICKGNTNLLGGDIHVESEPGKGSTFIFTINLERKKNTGKAKELKSQKVISGAFKNILLIEDDFYSIEYLKRIFMNSNFNLSIARNGKETQNYYKNLGQFDLVLLDMRLPDADGLDLVRQIKELHSDLPVIAQTAFATEEDRKNCLEAGCDDFITKPFKKTKLFSVIETFLG